MNVNLRKVDLNLLNIFIELMKDPNLTSTAQRLNMTQPAVSMALKRLRSLYNDPLFVRDGRQMVATNKAQQLQPTIAQALAIIAQTLPNTNEFEPLTATTHFRINVFAYAEQLIAASFLEKLNRVAPHCTITISSEYEQNPQLLLLNRNIDLHLDYQPIKHPDFHSIALEREKIVVVARNNHPRLGHKSTLTMADFMREKHAVSTPSDNHKTAMKYFIKSSVAEFNRREIGYHGSSEFGVVATVNKSDMLTIAPLHIVTALNKYYDLITFEPPFECNDFITYMSWYAGMHHDKSNQWLRQFIISNIEKMLKEL